MLDRLQVVLRRDLLFSVNEEVDNCVGLLFWYPAFLEALSRLAGVNRHR